MNIIFVTEFEKQPITGLCKYNGELCRFILDFENRYGVNIYYLTLTEKISWLFRKWFFEICVGRHYTYKNNKPITEFHWRYPIWLHKKLYNMYFRLNRGVKNVI